MNLRCAFPRVKQSQVRESGQIPDQYPRVFLPRELKKVKECWMESKSAEEQSIMADNFATPLATLRQSIGAYCQKEFRGLERSDVRQESRKRK